MAEARLDVVNPETVRVPAELDRPLPNKLLKDELLTSKLVVLAVTKDA